MILTKFEEGDQVWLEGCHLKTHHPTMKLAPRRYGPFPIIAKLSPVTYRLNLPLRMKVHNVFHVDLLTRYRETDAHGPNYKRPTPDIIEGEPKWEVESILGLRLHGCRRELQFLIKWKGFPTSENSWEAAPDVHAPLLIADFIRKNPNTTSCQAPRHRFLSRG